MELLLEPDVNKTAIFEQRMAKTFDDRVGAFRLTNLCYRRAGLNSAQADVELRVTSYQLLPDSRIFITQQDGETVSTISLVPDSQHGLPIESAYHNEIASLRDRGLWVAEVSCLADRRRDPRRFIENFCVLTRMMAQHAVTRGIDGFVIAVHPRHVKFYKAICFHEIGGLTDYPLVGNRPAIALYLDFHTTAAQSPEKHALYFGESLPSERITGGEMDAGQVDYFSRFVCDRRHVA